MASTETTQRNSARSRVFMLVRSPGGSFWAWDIGLGGMSAKTKRVVFPGTFLDLQFTLPGTTDPLALGAQVVGLAQDDDGTMTVSLRFCRVPDNTRLALYRFLDRRRYLWEDKKERLQRLHPHLAGILDKPEPFAELLREAYNQLRLKELRVDGKTVVGHVRRSVA
jgi:hypothetical protein